MTKTPSDHHPHGDGRIREGDDIDAFLGKDRKPVRSLASVLTPAAHDPEREDAEARLRSDPGCAMSSKRRSYCTHDDSSWCTEACFQPPPSKQESSLNWCGSAPELDEAGKAALRDKAQGYIDTDSEAHSRMSDEWVADRVRMLMRMDIDHEGICCAARDRIMRLSLQAAALKREQDKYRQAVAAVIEYFRHRLRGTTHWHGCESAHPECAMLESLCRLQVAPETEGKHDHG